MKVFSQKNKGVVLITTLFITTFLVMLAAGTLSSSMMQLRISSDFYQRESAHHVAMAGINYAMHRLDEEPSWKGCKKDSAGKGEYQKTEVDGKLLVEEHPIDVDNALGAVEGRITIGENTHGYFDIYFVPPEDAVDEMSFFVHHEASQAAIAASPAGAIPSWIPISVNNNGKLGDVECKGSDFVKYKDVPGNTVLLVCRGRVGKEFKTIETCLRLNPSGKYDGVVSGKGDLNIGVSDGGKIKLSPGSFNKPPIMRSDHNINFQHGDATNPNPKKDYLIVEGNGGGEAKSDVVFMPKPTHHENTFQTTGLDNLSLPPIKMDDIKPDTSSLPKIAAGTYIIDPGPVVKYYPSVQHEHIYEDGPIEPQLSNDITARLSDGTLEWDGDNMTLIQRSSMAVESSSGPIYDEEGTLVSSGVGLSDVYIRTDNNRRLTYSLDANSWDVGSVFLVNENEGGGISVEGELSGIGTVLSKGDINLEASSQFSADQDNGLALYSEGNVTIHQIGKMPGNLTGDAWGTDEATLEEMKDLSEALWDAFKDYIKPPGDGFSEDHTIPFSTSVTYGPSGITTLTSLDANSYLLTDGVNTVGKAYKKQGSIKERIHLNEGAFTAGQWTLLQELGLITGEGANAYFFVNKDTEGFFSTLMESGRPNLGEGEEIKDSVFRGLVFACKNFDINTQDTGFRLEGALVAFGGIPEGDEFSGAGNVNIRAKNAEFIYETKYLSVMNSLGENTLESLYWGTLPR